MDLTARQQEILDFIRRYLGANGYPPTVRDIGRAVGLTSSSTVHAHLANLERAGVLRRDPTKPRAIMIVGDRASAGPDSGGPRAAIERVREALRPAGLPLLGAVAAGAPILAEEHIEEYVEVPQIAGGDSGDFVLRVRGESMRDAGILDGDFVVVRSQQVARDGEMVVALVDNEATVKRFFRESDQVRLEPANPDFEPIRSADANVIGAVVGVFRRVA